MKPNILLILSDQLRYDALSAHGNNAIQTTHLDTLIQDGVDFSNCYVNCPLCTPSRASIFTGQEPPRHGVYKLHDILPESQVLFPETLRQNGYETSLVGKLHVSARLFERDRRNRDGFDRYELCNDGAIGLDDFYNSYGRFIRHRYPEVYEEIAANGKAVRNIAAQAHLSAWISDRVIHGIETRSQSAPFFMCASYFDPHDPYFDYPAEIGPLVDETQIPLPQQKEANCPQDVLREGEKFYKRDGSPLSESEVHAIRKGYYAKVKFMDLQIGRILDCLREQGLYDDTLIIFASDHGDMLGDRDLLGKGGFYYDAGTRTPLIVKWPKNRLRGTVCGLLVQPHLIADTVLWEAGIPPVIREESVPLQLLLDEGEESPRYRGFTITQFRNSGYSAKGRYYEEDPLLSTMVRTYQYKAVVYHSMSPLTRDKGGELYDMINDPAERENLWDVPSMAEVKFRHLTIMMNWFVKYDTTNVSALGGELLPWEMNVETFSMVKQ